MPSRPAASAEIATASDFLFANSWISASPPEFRTALLGRAVWRQQDRGDIIARAGDTAADIFGLATGTMSFTTDKGPADNRLTHIMHPGDWFGVVPILNGGGRSGEIAMRTSGLLARIPGPAIEAMMAETPRWWREIGRLSVLFAQIAAGAAADLMIADNRQRCAATLLRLAGVRHRDRIGDGDGTPVVAELGQDELGAVANLSRNSVNRILRDFDTLGLVQVGYRTITLPDAARLRALID